MVNITTTSQKKLTEQAKEIPLSEFISKRVSSMMSPQETQRFITGIISAVNTNPALAACTRDSIVSSALLGESLKLSPSPQLGQYYMVPFKKKGKNGMPDTEIATFILGVKGYKQLAMRSGQYLDIDVITIKEGEYLGRDSQTGKPMFNFITDDVEWEKLPTAGYLAYFELLNGFKKQVYWTKSKMEKHADTYSKAFNLEAYNNILAGKVEDDEMWKYSSYWYKDFEGMSHKTVIRHLISQWGTMSIDMQKAFENDASNGVETANNATLDFTPQTIEKPEQAQIKTLETDAEVEIMPIDDDIDPFNLN